MAASLGLVVPCLLLLLLMLVDERGESVPVVAFEDHHASFCTVIKQDDGKIMAPQQVCGWLRIEAVQRRNPATLMYLSTQDFNITAGIDAFRLWVTVSGVLFNVNQTLEAERWKRLCLGLRPIHAASLSFQHHNITPVPNFANTPANSSSTTPSSPSPRSLYLVWMAVGEHFLNVTETDTSHLHPASWKYCFGHFSVKNSSSFVGFVAAISTESSIDETPSTNVSCSEGVSGSVDFFLSWASIANVILVELEEQQMCSEQVHEIILYATHGYAGFKKMCSSLGGHFVRVENAVAGEVDNHNCLTKEGFVSWLSDSGEKKKGTWSSCPALFVNGTAGQRLCVQDLPCSKCLVPSALLYYFYGPVQDFDREYSLRMLPNGSFYFEGRYTSNISRWADGWMLWSNLHHRWWRLRQGAWPLGRLPWYSPHLNATLTLTSCNAIQFPTDDGSCLLRSQRCDGYQDHLDGSDEVGCRDKFLHKGIDYNKNKSPFETFENGPVTYLFKLINIDKITAAQDVAAIEFALLLRWHDHRLKFVDSKLFTNDFSCEEIWTPELYLYAGYRWGPQVNVTYVRSNCYVLVTRKLEEEVDMTDPFVGKVTSEASVVSITMRVSMQVSSACNLKLSRYPFGRYACNMTIQLSPVEWVKWAGTLEKVSFSQDHDLLDYHLDNVTLEPHHDTQLTLTLHLSGLADYHLLGSFSPSGLMFLICYSTVYYPIGDFNERLMASLTSLLVLVALFSQTTAANVKTPYYKLLDVWYVVLIALCFLVVISNSVIHMLHCGDRDARTVAANDDDDIGGKRHVTKRAFWCNMICRYVLLFIFVLLIIVYVLIGNEYL